MFMRIFGNNPDFKKYKSFRYNGKRGKLISTVPMGFDIETTNVDDLQAAFMYIWQFSIDHTVFIGRTWDDFFDFLHWLTQPAYLGSDTGYKIIFIHNMAFEMSFLLPQLASRGLLKRVFAKNERQPLEVEITNNIIFRDTMALTNMSLSSLAHSYTKTQKLTGDLDYSVQRNYETELTDDELNYCINDVVILAEYAEQLHEEYTKHKKKIPLTSTGIVRQYVKEQIEPTARFSVKNRIAELFPDNVDQYNYTMRWLFRGGYTHAQTAICGDILEDVTSFDFTSAYPSVMIHNVFPSTPFIPVKEPDIDKIAALIDGGKAVIFMVDFYNITATGDHVVESKHKIIDYEHAIFENGRLYCADRIRVLITDVDFDIYKMFYKWSSAVVISAKCAHKKRLPAYLFNSVLEFYKGKKELKERVKKAEKEYDNVPSPENEEKVKELKKLLQKIKGMLNSCYGMCVSRLNFEEFTYDVNGWHTVEGSEYKELKKQQFLSPYWGIYVTAYCRRNILTAIQHFGDKAVYSDTDSIKLLPADYNYFTEYNAAVEKQNELICNRYDMDIGIYHDLGMFDNEGMYTRFKAWGAKRYVYEQNGHINAVVAGLPKSVSERYAAEHGNTALFDFFKPNMIFEEADKNMHVYQDEPVEAEIDGVKMTELSCCYITETSFKMTVEESFLTQIYERKELKK